MTVNSKIAISFQTQISSQRHRSSSGTSFDKYVASSLSTIQDNEDEEELLEAAEAAAANGLHASDTLASQVTYIQLLV